MLDLINNNIPFPQRGIMLQHFQSPFPLDSDQTIDRIIFIGSRFVDPPRLETQEEGRTNRRLYFPDFFVINNSTFIPKPTLIF